MPLLPSIERFTSSNGATIYRLPCEAFPGFVAFAHLVLGMGGPVLVDAGSGYGKSTEQLLAGLEAVGADFGEPFRPADIGTALVTHGHIDHFGGLHGLLASIGRSAGAVEVGIHSLDQHVLTAYEERVIVATKGLRSFLQQAGVAPERLPALMDMYGYSKKHVRRTPVTLELSEAQDLRGLRFIHVPGHCPGQMCIGVGDVLLAADHVLARTSPHMAPESITPSTGLGHYLDSLAKLSGVPGFRLALGGHEEPIHDLYGRIDEIRAGHDRKLARVFSLIGDEGLETVSRIAEAMYPNVEGFHVLLALEEVGAHVEYLYQHGRLQVANLDEVEREENPALRYRLAS